MEKSSEAGGLPLVFISKSYLLLLSVTLLLQGLAEMGRHLLTIIAPEQSVQEQY
jgi:TRAP-type mannitol/chloroaromatic compound transport system permease small subunit